MNIFDTGFIRGEYHISKCCFAVYYLEEFKKPKKTVFDLKKTKLNSNFRTISGSAWSAPASSRTPSSASSHWPSCPDLNLWSITCAPGATRPNTSGTQPGHFLTSEFSASCFTSCSSLESSCSRGRRRWGRSREVCS